RAVEQLMRLAGREHTLITAVTVLDAASGEYDTHLDVHRLTVRNLSETQFSDYVRRDQPLDCAGSYKIESLGIALMESIAGDDFTAITGLPLIKVSQLLEKYGLPIFASR
ncbi:MAG: septum formation protein, partial [Myxococcota bacterium]